MVIVGDFNTEQTLESINAVLEDWQPKQAYARIKMQAFLDVPGGKHVIQTPDKANAVFQAGHSIGIADTDLDYAALVLGNYIFGGDFLSSRIANRVRQQEGLSYSVNSSLYATSLDPTGRFAIDAICNPENISKVESAVIEAKLYCSVDKTDAAAIGSFSRRSASVSALIAHLPTKLNSKSASPS